jgi:hypothetical protein
MRRLLVVVALAGCGRSQLDSPIFLPSNDAGAGQSDLVDDRTSEPASDAGADQDASPCVASGDICAAGQSCVPVVAHGASHFRAGIGPRAAAIGDVDGDGRLDAVIANGGSNDVSVLLGRGDGTFRPAQSFAAGAAPSALILADLDEDGRLDVVIANQMSNDVSVLLATGGGSFTLAGSTRAGSAPVSLAAGDFDRDGHLDVAVTNRDSGDVSLLAGSGDGSLRLARTIAVGTTPVAVAAADLNRDGKLDLAVAVLDSNVVALLFGDGNGSFAAPVDLPADSLPDAIAAVDLDGDGNLDLVVAHDSSGQQNVSVLGVYGGRGDGTFAAAQAVTAGYMGETALAAGDFNRDGKIDVAVASADFNVNLMLGNGDGSFSAGVGSSVGEAPAALAAGDLDGDGAPDLVVAIPATNDVTVLLHAVDRGGSADGRFQDAQNYPVSGQALQIVAGDLDGDGRSDLVVATGPAGASVLMSRSDGTFRSAPNTPLLLSRMALGDMNGDGILDLVGSVRNLGARDQITVQVGNGDGTFRIGWVMDSGAEIVRTIAIADLNGDGLLDVAAAANGPSSVLLFLGDGAGGLAPPQPLPPVGPFAEGLVAVDLNGDGVLDLAVSDGPSSISVLLGNGDGTFQAARSVGVGSGPSAIATGDLNRDGLPDLAVTDQSSDEISILLGKGDGTFQSAASVPIAGTNGGIPTFVDLALADLNNDGVLDMALGDRTSIATFQGNGDGSFQANQVVSSAYEPFSVVAIDANGDGLLDLAAANLISYEVSVLLARRSHGCR